MNLLRRSKPLWLAALILLIIVNARSHNAESSGEYLQKVMIELQELNLPSNNLMMYDRLSSMNLGYRQAGYHDHSHDNRYRKISTKNHHDIQKPSISAEHEDMAQSTANNVVQYYAVRDSIATAANYPKVKQPEPLAFTRAELAALYKKALEKGSAISLASLTQALNAAGSNGNGNTPSQAGHPQLPVKPMYNYYFFPLKSFASELQRDHQTAIVPIYAATETAESTQKQLMNPLFVAIGTFVSMALLFMMGVLFLPKLPQLGLFNARVADNDDFLRLTTLMINAIERNRWQNFTTS
ncbi:uncharacterized protein LOC105838934 [Monomorium pharaonis]|uniref:uncharacterized protein LOC105838934 n=1 Tax=Monomorium pharaonis TaxID=307658 RepID=UPI00063F8AF0|nr:uncharacterized protein LOC105838934 [Monomorium pharaonis]XP_036143565.1 uncharacterized protein LOC105838934 [Monomorium pharaonis]XP_036143566.1 uncharacterized protein LOC105838934 [Monomorium pharaonis]XP_036143567.1 uncharacterized protein LOC105838934 [Monomorium pharaonis]XP_036143568.1 uncharacterized protein LOC105838934 [Monomorium pharaonis]